MSAKDRSVPLGRPAEYDTETYQKIVSQNLSPSSWISRRYHYADARTRLSFCSKDCLVKGLGR